jgi:hypothetical protein
MRCSESREITEITAWSYKKNMALRQEQVVAVHTKEVTQIWRDCASARIAIQSCLSAPDGSNQESGDHSRNDLALLRESAISLLNATAQRVGTPRVSETNDPWESIEALNDVMMKFCLRIADEWHEKTRGPNRKHLKALDQTISAQMEYVMTDPDNRAVKRCRGATEEEYDDAPLYAAILKESVQKGASGDDYRAMKMASKFGKKVSGKEVDRRASKGRKIRYSAIEKLSNFMAPRAVPLSEGIPITDEELINAFVNSVFQ